jgi:hypothetical protein
MIVVTIQYFKRKDKLFLQKRLSLLLEELAAEGFPTIVA